MDPRRLDRRQLLWFAVVCVALTWVPWAVLGALGTDIEHGAGLVVFGLAASGPSLAALVLWLRYRRTRRGAPVRFSWSGSLLAVVLGAAPSVLAAYCLHAGDPSVLWQHTTVVVAGAGGPLGALAYTMLSGPLSEEFGWRGYVQPRLRRHLDPVRTSLLLGIVWGAWHVPLFLLPGTGQHAIGLLSVPGALFFVMLPPLSYVALFVSERLRGGVLAAVLLHAAWNFADAAMPALGVTGNVIRTGCVVVAAGAAAFLWRRGAPVAAPADSSSTHGTVGAAPVAETVQPHREPETVPPHREPETVPSHRGTSWDGADSPSPSRTEAQSGQ
ncbi:MAG: type II CAAX endopeptidase family protein [Actinocatenispora sp.]